MQAPYGSWRSPITADLIVGGSIGLGQVAVDGDVIYWTEGRPTEGGRSVIVRRNPDGSTQDLTPAPFNARTRVHEYGGGEFVVDNGVVYFSNFADQRIYRVAPGEEPTPVTHSDGHRYADAVVDKARHRLICVREDHTIPNREAQNTIAAVDLITGEETILVSGSDFYASPRLSPDGWQLCWLAWDHPNMPWDGCELYLAELDPAGLIDSSEHIAGGQDESVFQPEWSPDGVLYFVADGRGWWNFHRWAGYGTEPLAPRAAEFGRPQWVFGQTTYAFASDDRIICTYCDRGTWKLASLDTADGQLDLIETPFTDIRGLQITGNRVILTAGSPSRAAAIVALDPATGAIETLRASSSMTIDEGYISAPETIEFPTEGGRTAFGFYYAPRNGDYEAPDGEKPPLLVMSHGGPTAATSATLSARVQYWTSRGIAVLDVNYGGSTGYGREYRRRLNGLWGIVDVNDCVNGALFLAQRGSVDRERLAITGGSAGGYTTLCALTFRDVFKAGASHYGVADLEALARDTHKFESRYLDGLIGPYPDQRQLYVERSPINHVDRLDCPVVFFQGLEDQVVPPNQAESMVAALRAKGVPVAYLTFEGEQHGFRQSANIKRALEGELYFYSRVFGFDLADPVEPLTIENLGAQTKGGSMTQTAPDTNFDQLERLITHQRAIRIFTDQPVDDALIERALRVATFAPSAHNTQPWRFIVLRNTETKRRLGVIFDELGQNRAVDTPERTPWEEVPLLIAVCGKKGAGGANIYPLVQNLLLALQGLGLGSVLTLRWRAREAEVRPLLDLPDDWEPLAILPVGWPTRRYGRGKRLPVSEVAYRERFGQAW